MTMNKKEIKTSLYRHTQRETKNYVNWGRTREKEQTITVWWLSRLSNSSGCIFL